MAEVRGQAQVDQYRAAQLAEFASNAHKGDWANTPMTVAVWELLYHVLKFAMEASEAEPNKSALLEFGADVGNCAIVLDVLDALDATLSSEDPTVWTDRPWGNDKDAFRQTVADLRQWCEDHGIAAPDEGEWANSDDQVVAGVTAVEDP